MLSQTTHFSNAEYAMQINSNAKAFTALSSQIYKEPIFSIFRELVCNAIDATLKANSKEKIVVNLPTINNPEFSVQDFGTGMSLDTIMNVYSIFFNSLKEDDKQQIGGFGLGGKTPFLYTNQFKLETTCPEDGVRRTFIFKKDENQIPGYNYLDYFDIENCQIKGTKVSFSVLEQDMERFNKDILNYAITLFPHKDKFIFMKDDNIISYKTLPFYSEFFEDNQSQLLENKYYVSIVPNDDTYFRNNNPLMGYSSFVSFINVNGVLYNDNSLTESDVSLYQIRDFFNFIFNKEEFSYPKYIINIPSQHNLTLSLSRENIISNKENEGIIKTCFLKGLREVIGSFLENLENEIKTNLTSPVKLAKQCLFYHSLQFKFQTVFALFPGLTFKSMEELLSEAQINLLKNTHIKRVIPSSVKSNDNQNYMNIFSRNEFLSHQNTSLRHSFLFDVFSIYNNVSLYDFVFNDLNAEHKEDDLENKSQSLTSFFNIKLNKYLFLRVSHFVEFNTLTNKQQNLIQTQSILNQLNSKRYNMIFVVENSQREDFSHSNDYVSLNQFLKIKKTTTKQFNNDKDKEQKNIELLNEIEKEIKDNKRLVFVVPTQYKKQLDYKNINFVNFLKSDKRRFVLNHIKLYFVNKDVYSQLLDKKLIDTDILKQMKYFLSQNFISLLNNTVFKEDFFAHFTNKASVDSFVTTLLDKVYNTYTYRLRDKEYNSSFFEAFLNEKMKPLYQQNVNDYFNLFIDYANSETREVFLQKLDFNSNILDFVSILKYFFLYYGGQHNLDDSINFLTNLLQVHNSYNKDFFQDNYFITHFIQDFFKNDEIKSNLSLDIRLYLFLNELGGEKVFEEIKHIKKTLKL